MTFLAFGGGDTPEHIADFISYYGLPDVPTVADEDGSIRSSMGVPGVPAWVFVDRDGETEIHAGALEPADLAERLDALLAS